MTSVKEGPNHSDADAVELSQQLRARIVQLETQLNEDSLSGVKSRLALTKRIENADQNLGSILVIDIDGFRDVNHHYGHEVGDKLLKEIAANLKSELQGVADIYRWGGDEFCIITPLIHPSALQELGNRICEIVRSASIRSGCLRISRTASVGIAQRGEVSGVDELFNLADRRMFRCKAANGNCINMNDDLAETEEASIESVRRALQRNKIGYHVQPIFDITSGKIISYEALLRWIDGKKIKFPSEFLKQMTRSYDEETRPPLKKAQEVARWAVLDQGTNIHFNISTEFLERSANIDLSWVDEIIGNIDPRNVVFEIVETAMPQSFKEISNVIRKLRNLGIKIAIDDFGVGESSIERLQILDVDIVKIDRKFLHNVYAHGRGSEILSSIMEMTDRMDAIAIIEGVETAEQLELIKGLGFKYAQGYFLGKPNSVEKWNGFSELHEIRDMT